ncbi:carboxymuconolactone decarboxylase family protein [Mycobacterium sp.]|uniref:carboxymuconolactone decarboxylase family protein n=1 Tax=Mycobacterium sp. TaxID=1785 RepID=UPI0039C9736B
MGEAGPLDVRTKRLVHLALAIGADSHGAVHSHARRGLAEGLSAAELEHVALLAVTTLGWPQAVKGITWIRDVTSGA